MAFWKNAKAESRQDPLPPENVPAPEEVSPKDNHLSFDEIFGAIQENLQQDQKPYTLPEQPEAEMVPEEPIAPHLPRQPNRKRSCDIHVRFSESEIMILKKRVSRSGMNLSDYIRQVALNGELPGRDRSETAEVLREYTTLLDDLTAELGRQGGMLKLNMKTNVELKQRDPSGWTNVEQLIRFLERYVRIFREKLEQIPGVRHSPSELHTVCQDMNEVMISVRAQGIGLRDIIRPDLGQRIYSPGEWKTLCEAAQAAHKQCQSIVSGILEEINGYYQAHNK